MSKYIINGHFLNPSFSLLRVHNDLFDLFVSLYRQFSQEEFDSGIRINAIDILFALHHLDSYLFTIVDLSEHPQLTKQNIDFLHEVLKSSKYSRKRQVSRK